MAIRIVPVIVEVGDDRLYVLKFHNAEQGQRTYRRTGGRRAKRRVLMVGNELSYTYRAAECLAMDEVIMAQRETEHSAYRYLVERPHPRRRQLSLRGRNITVGQFVASMRANNLSPAAAADNFDVPLAQVMEALNYYETHQSLVNEELREDKRRLQAKGYVIEPPAVSR